MTSELSTSDIFKINTVKLMFIGQQKTSDQKDADVTGQLMVTICPV